MLKKLLNYKYLIGLTVCILSSSSAAQDSTKSLAFKNKNIFERRNFFYQSDPSYQLWQQFHLIQAANSGDPLAEHELGIRYLLGEGVPADTIKGAYWIKKAAEKDLITAQFNFGILLLNGWGVDWNPFEAFKYFRFAAIGGMPAAQHILGIFYTDDLVVKANWADAYYWIKKSSDAGFEPAKEIIPEILKKYTPKDSIDYKPTTYSETKTENDKNIKDVSSNLGLVFINFDTEQDTMVNITNAMLIDDLVTSFDDKIKDSLNYGDTSLNFNNDQLAFLLRSAESGNPEALVILGKMYETGIYYEKNLVTASAYYSRAARLDSPKGLYLLWLVSSNQEFIKLLKQKAAQKNVEAMYVWYVLSSLGLENSIVQDDALNLLEQSAEAEFLPAMLELGLLNYTGKFFDRNLQRAFELWSFASTMGNKESESRLLASYVFDDAKYIAVNPIQRLKNLMSTGSIIAQVTLAYCFENGKLTQKNIAEAVKLYRYAAHRGNRFAYQRLKEIFDTIRPGDRVFRLN